MSNGTKTRVRLDRVRLELPKPRAYHLTARKQPIPNCVIRVDLLKTSFPRSERKIPRHFSSQSWDRQC